MRPLLALGAALLLAGVTSCRRDSSGDVERASLADVTTDARTAPADAAHGKILVAQYECNRCHEDTGHPPMNEDKHCVRCHQTILEGRFSTAKATPASIAKWQKSIVHLKEVPSLGKVGQKFRRDWVSAFLQHPVDLRPHLEESMPRFRMPADDAADIAAYLVTDETEIAPDASLAREGKKLFDTKGCATCHAFSGAPDVTPSPIPVKLTETELERGMKFAPDLRFARDRLQTGTVVAWLQDPRSVDSTARMPNLGLSVDEAKRLSAYVLTTPLEPLPPKTAPSRLPALDRTVTYAEIESRILRNTCWHCHAEPGLALGDGGPGNSGGLGFPPRGLNLADYDGLVAGVRDDDKKRHSVLKRGDDGAPPMLVAALLARQSEEAGVEGAVRGMPLGLPALSPEDIQLVDTWIVQGRRR